MVRSLAFAFATLTAALAFATEIDPTAEVRRLNESASVHYNLGEFDRALEDYTEAYRVRHDPVFLFDIGQCQRQLGLLRKSMLSYRAYLRQVPDAGTRKAVEALIADEERELVRREADRPPIGTEAPPPTPPAAPRAFVFDTTLKPPPVPTPWYRDGAGWGLSVSSLLVAAVGAGLAVQGSSTGAAADVAATATERARLTAAAGDYRIAGYAVLGVAGALAVGAIIRWIVLSRR